MKTINKLFIAALATTAMTACNNDLNNNSLNGNRTVNFTMGIGETASSRVSMNDGEHTATFSPNNAVGIFVEGQDSYKNLEYTTTDGTTWTGGPIKLPEGETYTYYAYYPYSKEVNSADAIAISVATDQETGGYLANDYLYCNTTSEETNVTLKYEHALSLVDVTLAGDAIGDDAVVSIINVATDATLDVTAPSVTTGTTLANVKMDVLTNTKNFRAIIPAQKITASTPVFRIETKGRTYEAKYNGEIDFAQGKYLALTITIGEEGGTPEVEITTSASINDWTNGGTAGGDINIGVTEFSIPLPTDGNFTEWKKGWSNSTGGNKIPVGGEEKWYNRINVVDSISVTAEYDEENEAIKFTNKKYTGKTKTEPKQDSIIYSKGAWNNNCIVFHSTTPLDTAYYKLTFKAKSSVESGVIGLAVTNSTDDRLFPIFQASNGTYWNRTVTTISSIKQNEWTDVSIIFGTTKKHSEGKSSGINKSVLVESTIEDVKDGVNIMLYASKDGVINNQWIKDIRIEKYNGVIKWE